MVLVIDVGNTSIKIAIMEHAAILKTYRCQIDSFTTTITDNIQVDYPYIKEAALCVVGSFNQELQDFINNQYNVFIVNNSIALPFNNKYQSTTLGNDRIALIAGALSLIDQPSNCLVIDAGTCITYDYIDNKRNYYGGAISPGLRLRYESLHNYTANLPLLNLISDSPLIGNTTQSSIHSGVINGLRHEIKGIIKRYKKQNKDLHIFITGGDAAILSTQLKKRFFATPFLMLQGIYKLYTYNKDL